MYAEHCGDASSSAFSKVQTSDPVLLQPAKCCLALADRTLASKNQM